MGRGPGVASYTLNFYSLQRKKEREEFSSCQGKSIQRIHLHNESTKPNKYSPYFSAPGGNEKEKLGFFSNFHFIASTLDLI